jgi:hypothetical protein
MGLEAKIEGKNEKKKLTQRRRGSRRFAEKLAMDLGESDEIVTM